MPVSLRNYTTKVDVLKTVGEIETILARHGVSRIMKEYDGQGGVDALTFSVRIQANGNDVPFRLPVNTEAVLAILQRQHKARKLDRRWVTKEQASRIGWRILKDWTDAQLALVQIGMVTIEQVFLPYLYNYATGQTLYQKLAGDGFNGFLLEAPK